MKCLGVILAGGKARRFGSDKALAPWRGMALIEHVSSALRSQCDALVIVGRSYAGLTVIDDLPGPGLGPLAGLAGALEYAAKSGFDLILSAGVDTVPLSSTLRSQLMPAPAFVADQPLVGLWPTSAHATALQLAAGSGSRAIRHFADQLDARAVTLVDPPSNINTIEDLALLDAQL
jgi:molybdenum cofactor guanylyltransferase